MGKEKKMMLDDFLALIPEEDKQRIDKQIDKMLEQENKTQSSIDWLVQQLKPAIALQEKYINEFLQQAKAMHKEEILQTFEKGYVCGYRDNGDGGIDYYNETFGGDK